MPSEDLNEKYIYAHYLSYATLVSFVAYVGVEFFQLPCGHIFKGISKYSLHAGVQCAVCSVHCALCSVHCALSSVEVCSLCCAMFSVQYQ